MYLLAGSVRETLAGPPSPTAAFVFRPNREVPRQKHPGAAPLGIWRD